MDCLIDPYAIQPPAPLPLAEYLTMVSQSRTFGGPPVGSGMVQSGPAVASRQAFNAQLASFVTTNLNHLPASSTTEYNLSNPMPLWGGFGTLAGDSIIDRDSTLENVSAAGRGNTSENATGNWYEGGFNFTITLSAPRNAFGCYIEDIGDAGGEVEIQFLSGGSLLRTLAMPVAPDLDTSIFWVGYSNAATSFDQIKVRLFQFTSDPDLFDYFGFDDFTVGTLPVGPPPPLPQVFYAENGALDPLKVVVGPALAARNAWQASASAALSSSVGVCDFEAATVTATQNNLPMAFTGGLPAATMTATQLAGQNEHTLPGLFAVSNSVASASWNTTAGGGKFIEFTSGAGQLEITFASAIKAFGLYVTDAGDLNATLKVTLKRANGAAVVHYMPKATALNQPASRLRFWGVTGEVPFVKVIIRRMYYVDLVPDSWIMPHYVTLNPVDVMGIDDVVIGT